MIRSTRSHLFCDPDKSAYYDIGTVQDCPIVILVIVIEVEIVAFQHGF